MALSSLLIHFNSFDHKRNYCIFAKSNKLIVTKLLFLFSVEKFFPKGNFHFRSLSFFLYLILPMTHRLRVCKSVDILCNVHVCVMSPWLGSQRLRVLISLGYILCFFKIVFIALSFLKNRQKQFSEKNQDFLRGLSFSRN